MLKMKIKAEQIYYTAHLINRGKLGSFMTD